MKVCEYAPYTSLSLGIYTENTKQNSFLIENKHEQTQKIVRNSQSCIAKNYSLKNPFSYDQRSRQKIKGGVIKISTLIQSKSLSFQCFLSAATLFYSYITANYITEQEISPVAITCVYVASKITEVQQLTPTDIKDLVNDNYKISQIIQIEGKIISTLNFDLFVETPISNILWEQSSFDEQKTDKLCFLIEMSLMSGYEILNDFQKIQQIIEFVKTQTNGTKLGQSLIPLLRNYEVKITTFKYSLKFDVNSFTDKFYE